MVASTTRGRRERNRPAWRRQARYPAHVTPLPAQSWLTIAVRLTVAPAGTVEVIGVTETVTGS